MDPTMIGNQVGESASAGMYPKANMPVMVLARSAQVPTSEAITAVPITRNPIRKPSRFSRRL